MIRFVFLLVCVLIGFTTLSCIDEPTQKQFILYVSVDVHPDVQATSVRLTPGPIRLHVVGTPRAAGWTPEALNDEYWAPIDSGSQTIELLELGSDTQLQVIQAILPEGNYDHLYLEVEALEASDETGTVVPCKNVIEPIAIDFDTNSDDLIKINLELFIAADWPEDGHCSVLAKDASILEPTP